MLIIDTRIYQSR